jgi:hypothetical protein
MLKLVARLTLGVNDFYNFAGSTPAIHNFINLKRAPQLRRGLITACYNN